MGKTNRPQILDDRDYLDVAMTTLKAELITYMDGRFQAIQKILTGGKADEPQPVKEVPNWMEWKVQARREVDRIVKLYPSHYADFNCLLKAVYRRMRNTYSVVFEQDIKDYMYENAADKRPSTLEIIAMNKQYRSLFECILANLEEESKLAEAKKEAVDAAIMLKSRQEIIQPLIEARGDKSNYGCVTHTVVMSRMKSKGFDFSAEEANYKKKSGIKRKITNKELIENNEDLKRMFIESVTELLNECKKAVS